MKHIDDIVTGLFSGMEFPAEPSALYDPLRYMIDAGGKRIRPRLCLLVWSLFSGDWFREASRRTEPGREILEPAAALEVFHSFTLIHDDIMDRSELRRGAPTVWKKWSEDTAILSGDVMSIESYRRIAFLAPEHLAEGLELFTRTAALVCEGQQYDMDFESVSRVEMDDYMKMIGLKTAVLISCAAKLGAIMGGASREDADRVGRYGYNLGLAFQVADDYLDAFGDEKVFGKPIGGDIVNGKKSWMNTRAQQKAPMKMKAAMSVRTLSSNEEKAKIEAVKQIYRDFNIDAEARQEILRLHGLAMREASLLHLPEAGIAALGEFADSLVGRTK